LPALARSRVSARPFASNPRRFVLHQSDQRNEKRGTVHAFPLVRRRRIVEADAVFELFPTRAAIRTIARADHIQGGASAPVTVVQYGDYLTDASRELTPVVHCLLGQWDGHLKFVYRHFPSGGEETLAWKAAEAAEAAAAQGKFWEMHACLLRRHGKFAEEHLTHCAARVGLDVRRFSSELADSVYAPAVQVHQRGGLRGGVHRPPALFINGHPHHRHTLESLSAAVARALLHA
jgi:protein-disulfide isomerase